jgi:hypothetical protein
VKNILCTLLLLPLIQGAIAQTNDTGTYEIDGIVVEQKYVRLEVKDMKSAFLGLEYVYIFVFVAVI